MRVSLRGVACSFIVAGLLLFVGDARAQAPAGSTGQCNDLSYSSAKQKWQACRGHKGVKSWFADSGSSAPAAAASSATAATPAAAARSAAPASPPAATAQTTDSSSPSAGAAANKRLSPAQHAAATPQAPGGGGGKVWLNSESKVYHCEGSAFYGRTKSGKYVTEAEAKAAGAHPDRNKPCAK